VRARAIASAATTVFVVASVLPWTVRNCRALDGCAFLSTNGGSNLAIGAIPRATGGYLLLTANDGCSGVVGEVARDRCWRRVAIASVRANPWRWIERMGAKLDHTLSYESYPIGYLRESGAVHLDGTSERTVRRAISAPWRSVLALALLALLPLGSRVPIAPAAFTALAGIVATLAPHLVFFGGDRYHLVFVPLVAALAAGAARSSAVLERANLRESSRPVLEARSAPSNARSQNV
jgi:hypothetical protein